MTDSVQVFPPGFRVTDNATGAPAGGATIEFYNAAFAGTKTVYSNSGLSTSLGVIVYTDALGTPVASFGSSTAVMVYVGPAPYAVIIKTAGGVTIRTLDNIKGALDTSTFLTTGSVSSLSIPVVTKTTDYTMVAADNGKLINANTTGGSFALALDAAATLGDGWSIEVRNAGTNAANFAVLGASEAIAFEGGSFTARALQIGEAMTIRCDGSAFKIVAHAPPLMASRGPGIITIATRVSSGPSAVGGARYIVSAGFSSYATGDIIEGNNSSFNKYTPVADCGWLAYVQDEDALYQFRGSAWVCLQATQAQAEAGSDNTALMTALRVRQAQPARAYTEYATNADLSTVIPLDDTKPQNTEGTQILTVSITPKSTASRIRIRFTGFCSVASAATAIAALFKDSGADAIQATAVLPTSTAVAAVIGFDYEHAPATVSAITYAVRVGASTGNIRMNGTSAARLFGAAAVSTLVLEEVFA